MLLKTSISCRPTHFIAAQLSDETKIIQAIQEVQKALVGHTAGLKDTLVEPATAHFTLMVQPCLQLCSAFAKFCMLLRYPEQAVTEAPDAISFEGPFAIIPRLIHEQASRLQLCRTPAGSMACCDSLWRR